MGVGTLFYEMLLWWDFGLDLVMQALDALVLTAQKNLARIGKVLMGAFAPGAKVHNG